jgi:MFS family permease
MVCSPKPGLLPALAGNLVFRNVRVGVGRHRHLADARPWSFPVLLSLMATAASAPFFLFTLPAGAVADIVNRRTVIVAAVLWQAAWSAVLAFGAWTDTFAPGAVLACIFALGIGLAFGAPVWGAVVPDIVRKEELPSAITLGGVQLNLSGIVGPALGGFLLPCSARSW